MALLEKQKSLKLSKPKVVATKPKPSSDISVTIANDLFNHQPKTNEQIVQLNGTDTNSWKENHTEISVTFHSEIRKENSNVSRISTATVVTDSGIKIKVKSKVPEKCDTPSITPKKAVATKSEEPEQLTNLQNFSTLSEQDKNDLLQKSESEYMCHRYMPFNTFKITSLLRLAAGYS